VTFFFNDYTEKPFKGEDRQIVPLIYSGMPMKLRQAVPINLNASMTIIIPWLRPDTLSAPPSC